MCLLEIHSNLAGEGLIPLGSKVSRRLASFFFLLGYLKGFKYVKIKFVFFYSQHPASDLL